MSQINDVFSDVLKEITPTNKEITIIESITEKLKKLLVIKAKELNIDYIKIEPQGSTGIKQTQLKNDFDIDLFIGLDYELYSPKYDGISRNKLKKESKKDFLYLCNNWILKSLILKEFHNPRLLYAEHPYVTVDYFINNIKIKIDIVLYFDLELEYIKKYGPITAVDRSPWHGRFIEEKLSIEQKNDVRLLKQFFKANHSYGDKSAVGKVGFIGYSAELLIYYYDTLQNLLNNFKFLKEKPSDYYNRTLKELRKIQHFQNDYVIITDPIDKNRNVASAISEKAYKYCNQRIMDFMNNPNISFFKIDKIPEVEISKIDKSLLAKIFIAELKNENKEIHYTINRDKLYSIGENIKVTGEKEFSHAERFGKIEFEVYFEEDIEEYNLAIFCEKPKITKNYERRGPPIKEKNHANKFRIKNPNFFERDEFLWIESEREYTEFLNFLIDFVKNKIPENLTVVNISESFNVKRDSSKRAIYTLINMILPFT